MKDKTLKAGLAGMLAGSIIIGGALVYEVYSGSYPDSLVSRAGYGLEELFKYESDDGKLTVRFGASKLIAYAGILAMGISMIPVLIGMRREESEIENTEYSS